MEFRIFSLLLLLIPIVLSEHLLSKCDYFKLENAKRKFEKCDGRYLIVDKLRGVNKRDEFWCITFYEDSDDVKLEVEFNGPWAIEARGIEKPTITGNSIEFFNQPSVEIVRLVIKKNGNNKLPDILSLKVDGVEKCESNKWRPQKPAPGISNSVNIGTTVNIANGAGEFDDIFQINFNITCGKRFVNDIQPLISDGRLSDEGAWPWHVAIYHRGNNGLDISYKCGGTLVEVDGVQIVLTAAHCIFVDKVLIPNTKIVVKAGINNLESTTYKEFLVDRVYKHENYVDTTTENDIAILKLNGDIEFDRKIQPACMPKANIDFSTSSKRYVIGFGVTEQSVQSKKLLEININPITPEECYTRDEQFFSKNLFDTNYCAEGQGNQTACKGDSGSGNFEEDEIEHRFYLQGIVSFTKAGKNFQECNPSSPVVFTNVYKFEDWIRKKVDHIKRNHSK